MQQPGRRGGTEAESPRAVRGLSCLPWKAAGGQAKGERWLCPPPPSPFLTHCPSTPIHREVPEQDVGLRPKKFSGGAGARKTPAPLRATIHGGRIFVAAGVTDTGLTQLSRGVQHCRQQVRLLPCLPTPFRRTARDEGPTVTLWPRLGLCQPSLCLLWQES